MDQPYVRRAVEWLASHQNPDGGWGESCGSYVEPELHGVGPSTASQTAWALLALIAANQGDSPAVKKGAAYLIEHQKDDGGWEEPYFTGTGFPGYGVGERLQQLPKPGEKGYQGLDLPVAFMINYRLYRYYWPLMALGRYASISSRAKTISRGHHVNGSVLQPPNGRALQGGAGSNGKALSLPKTVDKRI